MRNLKTLLMTLMILTAFVHTNSAQAFSASDKQVIQNYMSQLSDAVRSNPADVPRILQAMLTNKTVCGSDGAYCTRSSALGAFGVNVNVQDLISPKSPDQNRLDAIKLLFKLREADTSPALPSNVALPSNIKAGDPQTLRDIADYELVKLAADVASTEEGYHQKVRIPILAMYKDKMKTVRDNAPDETYKGSAVQASRIASAIIKHFSNPPYTASPTATSIDHTNLGATYKYDNGERGRASAIPTVANGLLALGHTNLSGASNNALLTLQIGFLFDQGAYVAGTLDAIQRVVLTEQLIRIVKNESRGTVARSAALKLAMHMMFKPSGDDAIATAVTPRRQLTENAFSYLDLIDIFKDEYPAILTDSTNPAPMLMTRSAWTHIGYEHYRQPRDRSITGDLAVVYDVVGSGVYEDKHLVAELLAADELWLLGQASTRRDQEIVISRTLFEMGTAAVDYSIAGKFPVEDTSLPSDPSRIEAPQDHPLVLASQGFGSEDRYAQAIDTYLAKMEQLFLLDASIVERRALSLTSTESDTNLISSRKTYASLMSFVENMEDLSEMSYEEVLESYANDLPTMAGTVNRNDLYAAEAIGAGLTSLVESIKGDERQETIDTLIEKLLKPASSTYSILDATITELRISLTDIIEEPAPAEAIDTWNAQRARVINAVRMANKALELYTVYGQHLSDNGESYIARLNALLEEYREKTPQIGQENHAIAMIHGTDQVSQDIAELREDLVRAESRINARIDSAVNGASSRLSAAISDMQTSMNTGLAGVSSEISSLKTQLAVEKAELDEKLRTFQNQLEAINAQTTDLATSDDVSNLEHKIAELQPMAEDLNAVLTALTGMETSVSQIRTNVSAIKNDATPGEIRDAVRSLEQALQEAAASSEEDSGVVIRILSEDGTLSVVSELFRRVATELANEAQKSDQSGNNIDKGANTEGQEDSSN